MLNFIAGIILGAVLVYAFPAQTHQLVQQGVDAAKSGVHSALVSADKKLSQK